MIRQLSSRVVFKLRSSCHARQMSVVAKCLKYVEYGEPGDVLRICEEELPNPIDNEVLVETIAAPINPADINTIQGKYPVKPSLPAVGGNEFVANVICVGNCVKDLKPGDRVIAGKTGIGTWTTHGIYDANDLMKISKKIGIIEAATLTVNPCTAYRMLKDFVNIKPGDTIIQNGANSAVGQCVHQLCAAWGICSVGVVRDRPNICELKDYLKKLGATQVLTEAELRTTNIFKDKLKKPMLGLNCIGGKSSTEISRCLNSKGVHVTYGGMSREPVTAGTASLIFKDLSFRGFWMTRWSKEHFGSAEMKKMFDELGKLMEDGKFIGPAHEMVPLEKYKEATAGVLDFKGFKGKKYIIKFKKH